ncbi:MAG: hypothetical protein AAFQ71_08800 [Planctomycetota bacterium]
MRRKLIRTFVIHTLVGVLTSVAIAWALAWLWPLWGVSFSTRFAENGQTRGDLYRDVRIEVARGFGFHREVRARARSPFTSISTMMLIDLESRTKREIPIAHHRSEEENPRLDRDRLLLTDGDGWDRWEGPEVIDRRGWPFLCAESGSSWESRDLPGGGYDWVRITHLGIRIDGRGAEFDAGKFRSLPLRPIWFGLAINTASYAAASFALVSVAGATRRYNRFQRGRCPHCGYDLGFDLSTGCPECGWRKNPS